MTRQVRLIVSGRVQGVFYRASAKDQALSLNISGYAKNLPDGSVEVIAGGSPENIEKFIAWCGEGPVRAKVSHVKIEEIQIAKPFAEFEIF